MKCPSHGLVNKELPDSKKYFQSLSHLNKPLMLHKDVLMNQEDLNNSVLLKKFKVEGYLVTIDIEKDLNSLHHTFLISTLEKFGFGKTFIDWIKK